MDKSVETYTSYLDIPYNVFAEELSSADNRAFQREINEIKGYYETYKKGALAPSSGSNGDYTPSSLRYKKIKTLIDTEARFLFSVPVDFIVNKNADKNSEAEKLKISTVNNYVHKILKNNKFNSKLVQAAKDCFIGKRIAYMLNFNEDGVSISFFNSQEFLYEYKGSTLIKLVAIYVLKDSDAREDQIVQKKKYEMHDDGYCYVEEALYSGSGIIKEEGRIEPTRTEFQYIPGGIISNEGMLNEVSGESEVDLLDEYEVYYTELANNDIDAEKKGMNPVRYTIDASPESTTNLSSAPGSFWDLATDHNNPDATPARAGMLEANMSYSGALKSTLDRIEAQMYAQVSVPNLNADKLQGVITSGKTLKALYWSLIMRCNEKMLSWGDEFEHMAMMLIEGGHLYPESAKATIGEILPDLDRCEVSVENSYPLPEDETEEKGIDLAEVSAQVMSKKSYMKKWRNLTDEEVEEELRQIASERQILEDSFMPEE